MGHVQAGITWHGMTLQWETCLERSIDHMSKFGSFFMCSIITVSFRKLNTYVFWYWLTREVHPCVRVFQISIRSGGGRGGGGGIGNFTVGWEFFYRVKGTWGGVILTTGTFFKLKPAFCEYWASIKIKINMTCVSKEYEIKTKMDQEQWLQLKMLFLLGYNLKIVV